MSTMSNNSVSTLLTKRAGLHVVPEPPSKRQHLSRKSSNHSSHGIEACVELCTLLLEKAGGDVKNTYDEAELNDLLSASYSPRALELLTSITSALGQKVDVDDGSDLTDSSDEEADAVVPSIAESSRVSKSALKGDAVVPVPQPTQRRTGFEVGHKGAHGAKLTAGRTDLAYKKETEIAISRIFDLGKVKGVQNPDIPADHPYDGPSVITMTGFGELGRYGNQVMQYIFLKCYADVHNIDQIQVPGWVGAGLFGLDDPLVQRAFPPVVEFRGTLANSTFTTDFIDYVKNSNPNRDVPELDPSVLSRDVVGRRTRKNVDVWGWYQWHTSHFQRFKALIQDTFTPVPMLRDHCERIFDRNLRHKNGVRHTVVGLHLRLGDYQNISASSFGYCAPTSWYREWLEEIWPTLENPILFVASDDVDAVLRDFADYSPVTADAAGMKMPEELKHLKAGFFPDWFCLTQCDVLAISNSTFSFSACMMNRQPRAKFYRAHFKDRFVQIDPWNSDPIVHRNMDRSSLLSALETLQVVYNTQGSKGLARNLLYELPYYGLRAAIMKAVLWRQTNRVPSF